jgi:sugar (pentulose or hexulose) kinase
VGRPVATDTSHALKTGYDLIGLRWPTEVLETLHVDPEVLPPVQLAGSVLGHVGEDAAKLTGLPEGVRVIAGMTDSCAAQLAAGALSPGEWNSVLGTTLALKGVTDTLLHDPTGAVYSHRAPHGDLWLPGGASGTGAGAVTALFRGQDLDALTELARRVRDVPLCYPLAERGERFPFVEPDASGFLGDAPLPTGPDEVREIGDPARVFAAVCTGVAHVERLCFDLLAGAGADVSGPVSFTGGGSRNGWWNQLRCDLLGAEVHIPRSAEPSVGMAVLAAGAVEGDVPAAAGRMVQTREVLHPDPGRRAELAAGYGEFVDALTDRGWLDARTAAHARKYAAA